MSESVLRILLKKIKAIEDGLHYLPFEEFPWDRLTRLEEQDSKRIRLAQVFSLFYTHVVQLQFELAFPHNTNKKNVILSNSNLIP